MRRQWQFTQNARVVGGLDVCITKLGTLKLQSGVDHPQRSGNQYIYNTWRDEEAEANQDCEMCRRFNSQHSVMSKKRCGQKPNIKPSYLQRCLLLSQCLVLIAFPSASLPSDCGSSRSTQSWNSTGCRWLETNLCKEPDCGAEAANTEAYLRVRLHTAICSLCTNMVR